MEQKDSKAHCDVHTSDTAMTNCHNGRHEGRCCSGWTCAIVASNTLAINTVVTNCITEASNNNNKYPCGEIQTCSSHCILVTVLLTPTQQFFNTYTVQTLTIYSWTSKLWSHMVRYSVTSISFLSPELFCYIFNVNKIAYLDIQSFDIFSPSMSKPGPNTTFHTLRLMHGSKSKAVWVRCVTQQQLLKVLVLSQIYDLQH